MRADVAFGCQANVVGGLDVRIGGESVAGHDGAGPSVYPSDRTAHNGGAEPDRFEQDLCKAEASI